jgi:septal ring factor EnvC (AmiA/AmiB activator)
VTCALASCFAVGIVIAVEDASTRTDLAARLRSLQEEIARLERELEELQGAERGVLVELERLDAELRLRETEERAAAVRLEQAEAELEHHRGNLERLDEAQNDRRAYLSFRLREIYKAGSDQLLQRLLAGEGGAAYWDGLRYATLLSERDGRVLDAFRTDSERMKREEEELEAARAGQSAVHADLTARRENVARARARRAAALERIRRDEGQRRAALLELRQAAEELARLAEAIEESEAVGKLDVRRFRGLLEWPAEGELSATFGTRVHPEFRTRVPHPGWDIAAAFGSDIRTVFDGEVVFAEWLRGYGLTTIVDHGNGVLSIYAHASMLLVQPGERVARGQTLGQVGETGSLRGPHLYFELRVDGEAVDPAAWLRRR